ncbi:flagellar hook-associated protein FlgL [Georgenia subflava]|uniref:Flagellar hook-associated protein 3 n=1 Tax=Georgenia subflava TaxID=1622177 RepID=A0A6N7ENK0_9MICO|nr:flagellar hook-associated protein FlgL [Georgenia subflava]MPV38447.1 flagellar hook-associated protein 3 [Georgenia subflava]
MIGRITQQGMQQATLRHLQSNLSRMSELQQQASSGKAITKPSDDPAGTVDAMRIRGDQRATAQHARNAADAVGWLSTVDTALLSSTSLLRQARDLTVQGASSGSLSQTARDALAAELDATAEALRAQANATYLGRSVFAGTSNAGEAFTMTETVIDAGTPDERTVPVYTFTGAGTGGVERRIADNTTVRVDSDGATVFGNGDESVFALLGNIAADLRNGVDVGGRLSEIDTRMDAMLGEVAAMGTRYKQVLEAQEAISAREVTLQSQLTSVEDVDLAETIVQLKMQEVAYQAALSATQRTLQPSLLDFLR